MQLDQILKAAIRGGASDVILKVGALPKFRFNGELVPLSQGTPVLAELIEHWIQQIVPAHLLPKFHQGADLDFAMQIPGNHRFRVNLFRQRGQLGLVFRVILNHVRTLEELQLPKILGTLCGEKRGLILVTGTTGSGKSTTLAAMLQKINTERAAHIVTVEDPIEMHFQDQLATFTQREVGIDTTSFSSALRSALRQNPDVILVGELRDYETTATALMAAETGHLVMATLHTQDAADSLTRLLSYFPADQHQTLRLVLAQTLRAVLSQRLVRRVDGNGMIAAMEVLIVNKNVREQIVNASGFEGLHTIITNGTSYGMRSFDQSLLSLRSKGLIGTEEALKHATSRSDVELALHNIAS